MVFDDLFKAAQATEAKPFSQQELMLMEAKREEEEARKEMMKSPVQASGFHQGKEKIVGE